MSPQRIQRKRTKGFKLPPNTKCVNRGSRWGNPFYLWPRRDGGTGCTVYGQPWGYLTLPQHMPTYVCAGMAGDVAYVTCSSHEAAVEHSVDLFRKYCRNRQREIPASFARWLEPLRGKNLACFCAIGAPCHGDVLLELTAASPDRGDRHAD